MATFMGCNGLETYRALAAGAIVKRTRQLFGGHKTSTRLDGDTVANHRQCRRGARRICAACFNLLPRLTGNWLLILFLAPGMFRHGQGQAGKTGGPKTKT